MDRLQMSGKVPFECAFCGEDDESIHTPIILPDPILIMHVADSLND